MELTTYIRKPFTVEGVEITESNIAEIAELVGTLKEDDKGAKYIHLHRRLVPNMGRAYPGWFLTRMGETDNYRVYSPSIFQKEFMPLMSPVAWVFGDDNVIEVMDREGWNHHMTLVVPTHDPDNAPPEGIERPDIPDELAPDAEEVQADPPITQRTEVSGPEDTPPIDMNPAAETPRPGRSPLE